MAIHFKELAPVAHQLMLERAADQLIQLRCDVHRRDFRSFATAVRKFDARLDCESCPTSGGLVLTYTELAAVPLAQWLAQQVLLDHPGEKLCLHVGRPPTDYAQALSAAKRYGVDLSTSRVRVGFARGHLLDVYVLVPLDVEAQLDELQVAAEIFLENFVGDRILDVWVAQIAVDRIARSRGLKMVSDARPGSDSYELSEAAMLIERGISGLKRELPPSLLAYGPATNDWTALTIEEPVQTEERVLQRDRRFASTRFPEAVKASLIGLPFASERFTRGPEVLVWFSWSVSDPKRRLLVRRQVEEFFDQATSQEGNEADAPFLLAGTGFGYHTDYADVWIRPEASRLKDIGQRLAQLAGEVTLSFYDSIWADETAIFRAKTID